MGYLSIRGLHRIRKMLVWSSSLLSSTSGKIGYWLIRKDKKYLAINLKANLHLDDYFTLYAGYKSFDEYLKVQQAKTERRLKVFHLKKTSIMWTSENNMQDLAKILCKYISKRSISGVCMGSRSGEEQLLLEHYLGKESEVIGVELSKDASNLPNTVIADFHFLPDSFLNEFDFVYSNSHDQSSMPRVAFDAWIDCLRLGGLLILEHSRSHGQSRAGKQDPFGIETELFPYVMMSWYRDRLRLEGIYEPSLPFDAGHRFLIFSKKL